MISFLTYVASRPKDGFGNPVRATAIALILSSDDSDGIRTTADFKQWAEGLEPDVYTAAAMLWNEHATMNLGLEPVFNSRKGWL